MVARSLTSAADNRHVRKAELIRLRGLEAQGTIRMFDPIAVAEALRQGSSKLAKQAADVYAAMRRNREILIEGQVPAGVLEHVY